MIRVSGSLSVAEGSKNCIPSAEASATLSHLRTEILVCILPDENIQEATWQN